ncbi:conserved protein of unknown function [Magnetospirillum sp. XM-1]|uniref:DUF1566 domain-containing protein n=1 Tax=Magnetospirillum sp. XM-1 TaxID=1663591 RepID=UPI00073E0884|nr:DUF1566 domain-containing protein [Magnetospirillum sp. XM-1]CUW41662.1 conserved protein of unknown function [Magnetospirillum sp. XM-1]
MSLITPAIITPAIGTPMEGGFLGARYIDENGALAGLVVSRAEVGDFDPVPWLKKLRDVPGACSLLDGLANTRAMAEAGSEIAQTILDLEIDGVGGWHIPALDQMTGLRATAMPRAGITPAQSLAEVFQEGSPEAFRQEWYWTSTQYSSGYAWLQDFFNGDQSHDSGKGISYRVRAVRKCLL